MLNSRIGEFSLRRYVRKMMSIKTKQELARETSLRYRKASKGEKSQRLNEFMVTCQCKYAIGILNSPPVVIRETVKRPRATEYGNDVLSPLSGKWKCEGFASLLD